jgi:NTE family protein
MKTIGLALSGGGARGIGHLGVLKALDEMGVKVNGLSGTSSGAIVGAFYSAGYSPDEILKIAKETTLFGYKNFLIGKAGLFDMKTFKEAFDKYIQYHNIEQLPLPLTVVATDIVKGEIRYFTDGDLSMALMASSCVPLVFQPIQYESTIYLDGGILNNFPVEPLTGKYDVVIGVNVNAISKDIQKIQMKDMLDRSFHLALNKEISEKHQYCHILIEPPEMSRFGMFDMERIQEVFDFAYGYTIGRREEIMGIMG